MSAIPMTQGGSGGTLKRVSIGSGDSVQQYTFNVKSKLPDVYSKLTVNNFALWVGMMYGGSGYAFSRTDPMIKSYNASTGILTVAAECVADSHIGYTVLCYYVE